MAHSVKNKTWYFDGDFVVRIKMTVYMQYVTFWRDRGCRESRDAYKGGCLAVYFINI